MSDDENKFSDDIKQAVAEEITEAIVRFFDAVNRDDVPDEETFRFLAGRFSLWLEGGDTRKVFPKLGRGRRKSRRAANRRQRLATMVALCMKSGSTELGAIASVASKFHEPENTVKKSP